MLAALLAVAAFYLFHARIHAPRVERADALEARLQAMRERNDRVAKLAAAGGGRLEERLARYERHIARLETLIPASGEVAQLLEAVSREERRASVEVTMMRPQPGAAEESYERRSYELAVEGRYHAVGAFLAGVASLERIVVPDNVAMAPLPDSETGSEVLATLQIRTYVAAEPPSAAAAGAGPAEIHGATEAAASPFGPRWRPAPASRAPVHVAAKAAIAPGLRSAAWRVSAPVRPARLQETPLPAPEEVPPAPLAFEREVFRYPVAGRRDPFAVPGRPVAVASAPERFRLAGVILHDDPRLRLAILARAGTGRDTASVRPIRLRIGERAGRLRLLEVVARAVVLEADGPQGARVDTLRLPRPSAPRAR